jgi:DNA repair exonuclease SbcCD ATPase subunit
VYKKDVERLTEVMLKKISLKNYMGAENVEVDFAEKTEIRGKNRCGKSTLMNAYFDVMTGKFANGAAPTNICPVDENGEEKPVKEIERAVTLEINEIEHEIRKVTKRKYRRGVFIGNETVYMLDGVPAKSAEVNDFLASIAPPETVAMCSNASVFFSALKKSTADARKAIEGLSGFDVERFCKENAEYQSVYELTAGKKTEDVLKQLKKRISAENGELDRLNVELDYEQRRLDRSDDSELQKLESEKVTINGNIESMKNLKEALNVSIDRYSFLLSHIEKLKGELSEIEKEQTKTQRERISAINEELAVLNNEISEKTTELTERNTKLQNKKIFLALKDKELMDLVKERLRLKNADFIASGVCHVCGQPLPEERIEEDRERFEKEREENIGLTESAISSAETEIREVEEKFNLNSKKIEEITAFISEKKKRADEISSEKEKILSDMKFSGTDEYKRISKELKESEAEAAKIFESTSLWRQVTDRINNLSVELSQKQSEIDGIVKDREEAEKRISALKESVKEQAQKTADVERRIDMLQDFSIAKNAALENMVNSRFEFIKLKMSEETLSGDIKETLKINVNGVDYFNGLNHGDRILAEIFLLKGLQDMNSIRFPIWIDDTESLDESRIPDIGRQMILIRRTDEGKLKVHELEG